MANKYCSLITSLSLKLSKDDLKSLVFSCGDILPSAVADKIVSSNDLLRELKQRGQLGPSNYDFLREKLELIGRNDLAITLPDQVELYFGQPVPSLQRKTFLGFVDSPSTSALSIPQNLQLLKFCPPSSAPRVFLMHLCEQLSLEDTKKLIFLMNLPLHPDQVTSLELAQCFESKGGILSPDLIDNLIPCLNAVGRADLNQLLIAIKVPQALMSSLSTSQQQLNMKIGMLLLSKHQSYNLHMHILERLEADEKFRVQLMVPVMKEVAKVFNHSNILPLAQNLLKSLQSMSHSSAGFDSLLRSSLMKISHLHKCYSLQVRLLESSSDTHLVLSNEIIAKCHDFYHLFDSLMNDLSWNPEARSGLRQNIELQRTPFGSPGDHACQYILDLCQEVCKGDKLREEVQKIFCYLDSLRSVHYCCAYEVIASQWLATLVCLFTSELGRDTSNLSNPQFDLRKYKDLLLTIIEQNGDDIVRMYPQISQIVGNDVMDKLTPLLQSIGISQSTPHSLSSKRDNESMTLPWLIFNTFIMKLLAISTLDETHTYNISLMNCDFSSLSTNLWKLSATAMKAQVEIVREKALAENQLCSSLIAALTDNEHFQSL